MLTHMPRSLLNERNYGKYLPLGVKRKGLREIFVVVVKQKDYGKYLPSLLGENIYKFAFRKQGRTARGAVGAFTVFVATKYLQVRFCKVII